MKKHLIIITAAILVLLMAVPFAMVTSADVTLPAEPTVTNSKVVYFGHGGKGAKDGSNAANFLPTDGWDPVNYPNSTGKYPMNTALKSGGTFIPAGKGYVAATCTIAATDSPVLFTAWDGTKDYTGTIDGTTDANGNGLPDGQGTQVGMFMIASQKSATFMGDVIFDKITIIDRTNGAKAAEGTPKTTTYIVGSTGKMVIGPEVTITGSHNDKENSLYNPILEVKAGGYAFLHSIGFSKYTGSGTIVVGDEVKSSVTADTFADFDGVVVDKNGKVLFDNTTPDIGGGEAVALPAKPEATGSAKMYLVYDKTEAGVAGDAEGGATASHPYKTSIPGGWDNMMGGTMANGGTLVAAGKVMLPQTYAFPATTDPIVFTAVDGATDYTSRDANGNIYYMKADGKNGGQYGMFMIQNGNQSGNGKDVIVTFNGDVIFDNIVILSRLTENQKNKGEYPATISVKSKLWVKENVQFANMRGNQNYKLIVGEGAYAFLDAAGFASYVGTGTIVIGDAIKATVTEEMFEGFDGAIVDSQGNPLFANAPAPDDTTPPSDTTEPEDTTPVDPNAPVVIPAEPKDAENNKFYIAYDNNPERDIFGSADGGASAGHPYKTGISGGWGLMTKNQFKDGGKLVCVGKCYIPASFAFPATKDPIVFTAVDGGVNYTSRDENGNIYYMKEDGNNDGQYGMFMVVNSTSTAARTITFNGDVIFDNIVILSRVTQGQKSKGEYAATLNIKKSIVINSNVKFACMRGNSRYVLNVNEGAFAYLHATGFKKFTGTGTIVVGDELIGRVNANMFGGFKGRVVDTKGNNLFDSIPENPPTGDTFNPALVAIIGVAALTVGAVLTFGVATRRREQY